MSNREKIEGTEKAWEARELGASEEHVRVSTNTGEESVNSALELHPISIRLQKSLIEDLKHIASIHGIGYQPLMRQILNRFAESEKKRILREKRNELEDNGSYQESDETKAAIG